MPTRAPATNEPLFLALDQGGHSSRALVFDRRGDLVASHAIAVATHTPDALRVEQDPEAVVASVRDAAREVLLALGARASRVQAAGLATQRSSAVCWERTNGQALTPIMSWQDRRHVAWIDSLQPHAAEIHARSGLFLSPHYGASKLRWCLDHVDAVKAAAAQGHLAAAPLISFLSNRLLEEHPYIVDPANGSRTQLWNLTTGDWDARLAGWFGIPLSILPQLTGSLGEFGTLAIDRWRIPLRALNGDQPAALFADGRPRTDAWYINIGTGAFIQRPYLTPPPAAPRHLRGIALQGQNEAIYTLEATVNGAAAAIDWLAAEYRRAVAPEALDRCLTEAHAPPLFLNGVGGLAAPWWLPRFRSQFIGDGDFPAKLAAVLESVVFLIVTNIAALAGSAPPPEIILTGGWSHLDGIAQRLATLSGHQVACLSQSEATARGIAFLAANQPLDWQRAAPRRIFTPLRDPDLHARFNAWRDAMRNATQTAY